MIVECSRCGAPLNVNEAKPLTKCAYCGASSQTRSLKTVSPATPPGWRPPRQWTPPPHVPQPTGAPLPYRSPQTSGCPAVIAVIALLIAGGVAIGIYGSARKTSGGAGFSGPAALSGLNPARLATVTLRERQDELAKALGGDKRDNTLRVPLASKDWSAVTFEWDPAHPEHVLKFYLNCDSPHPAYAAVREKLDRALPKRWNGDSWQWEGTSLFYAQSSGVLSVNVNPEQDGSRKNPYWKQQSEALWSIVRSSALGLASPVDPAVVRSYLGGGYPITDISKVDYDADVDASAAVMAKVFPGAVGEKRISLDYTVALNHPWLEQAELSWSNEKGAKLKGVDLRRSMGKPLEHQEAIAKCVEAGFGVKPKVNESDYLEKKRDYSFVLKEGGHIRVYEHMVTLDMREYPFAPPMPKAAFDKALAVLDACGRK